MPLTAKQQRFVAEYLIDLNATQAAIRAGYSERTAEQIGYQQLQKTSVAEAIELAQLYRAEKLELTADKVLRDLEAARIKAMANEQCAAAIKAVELQGKHLGMFIDRKEVTTTRLVAYGAEKVKDGREWLEKHRPH